MCRFNFVFVILLIFSQLDITCAQNNTTILDILDLLGFDPLNIVDLFNLADTEDICKDVRISERDDLCGTQFKIICENQLFMSRMLDACSKFPYTGMLITTRLDYGSYDECIDLDLTQNGVRVIGKHCLGGIIIPTTELNDTDFLEKAFKLSICIPDGCTAADLMIYLNISSELQVINDASCSTKDSWKKLGADDYAVLLFLMVIVIIMIVSTVYDVYLYYTNQECPYILLQAFSVYYNGKKLLQVSKGPSDQIKVIHGLRVISMMWIVSGHAFGTMGRYPGINTDFSATFEFERKSVYITSAYLAVDTFFFLSGFLLAYQYLKQDPKPLKVHIKRIPYLYLHRYLRITPAVAVAFIIGTTLLIHLGNGPIYYDNIKLEQDTCLKYWWSFFLYIQNYVNYNNVCIINTWYLSADWQLFLLAPIVLIPVAMFVKQNFNWTMGQLLLLNVLLTAAATGLKFVFNDFGNIFETHAFLNDYFIGFTMGVFMREKCNLKYMFNTIWNFGIWLIVLFLMVITLLLYKEIQIACHSNQDDYSYYAYLILLRPIWCICLSWIIYSCHNGYGGFINWLLTTPCVQVLSKLTYCMYLVHVCPIIYFRLTTRVPLVYGEWTAVHESIVAYVATLVLALFWTLAFESPLIILEKYFMGRKSR